MTTIDQPSSLASERRLISMGLTRHCVRPGPPSSTVGTLVALAGLLTSSGCRASGWREDVMAVNASETALLTATRDKDWNRMFEFLPTRLREQSSSDRLGVAVEASGRLLISWEIGEVRSMKVDDSQGRDVDGFGVEVTGLWRNAQGSEEMYKEQWVDFWWKADSRWVWTGRD